MANDLNSKTYPDSRPRAVFGIEVDPTEIDDQRECPILNYVVFDSQACGGELARAGFRWIVRRVEDSDGAEFDSAIYLGDDPLEPHLLD